MSYSEAIDYLFTSQPAFHMVGAAAYKPGLGNTERLMAHLGDPHRHLKAVHIAGTNGKGSTSHLIAAALQAEGLKVGLYTSPHLVDFRERIRVNGEMIPEEAVVSFVEQNKTFLDELRPSFFETATGMAFDWFVQQQVDIAVIEVGLGGRLDATNILPPYDAATDCGVIVSVITNIGFDHTEFLGNTLAAIASEKAGIIKPGVPCVIGEMVPETEEVFRALYPQPLSPTGARGVECQLKGAYQQKNIRTACAALEVIGHTAGIEEGFAHVVDLTGLRGRWETLSTSPLTICDTGHNAHGIRTYVEQLRELHAKHGGYNCSQDKEGNSHLRIVFGMVADKDVDTVLDLLPKEAFYYWTQGNTHRAILAEEMRRKGLMHGLIGVDYQTVEQALHAAQAEATPEDIIFIGGSNYVVGEAIKGINN